MGRPRPSRAAWPRRWRCAPTRRRRRARRSRPGSLFSPRSVTASRRPNAAVPAAGRDGAIARGPAQRRLVVKPLRDVIAPGLDVLFCGINPSLLSAERGHHFARPGNRFWKALHGSGFTPRLLSPDEDASVIEHGLGITNVVDRPTRSAAELSPDELRAGMQALATLVNRSEPRVVAVVGLTAWRTG